MDCRLVLSESKVRHLQAHLGEDRVTIVSTDGDGYSVVHFEVRSDWDVLQVLHAGNDAGLEFGMYGPEGRPKQKVSVTVA
jgi:hypothetical protein